MSQIEESRKHSIEETIAATPLQVGEIISSIPTIEYANIVIQALADRLREEFNLKFREKKKYEHEKQTATYVDTWGGKELIRDVKEALKKVKYFGIIRDLQIHILTLKPLESPQTPKKNAITPVAKLDFLIEASLGLASEHLLVVPSILTLRILADQRIGARLEYTVMIDNDQLLLLLRERRFNAILVLLNALASPYEGGLPGTGKRY